MPKSKATKNSLSFIIATPDKQSVEEKRKTIRSHVMLGKNRKKLPPKPPSWIGGGKANTSLNIGTASSFSIPGKVGGEFSFAALSAELGPDVLETVWTFKETMMPLEVDIISGRSEKSWLAPIWNDAACLHFTVFISKVYLNHVHGQKDNNTAVSHLIKALAILQHRLASGDIQQSTSDSTILVVVGLTMAATGVGELGTAKKHLSGLYKMVELRGGIHTFNGDRQLQTKLFRADLGVSLSTGCEPLFFTNDISWKSYFASQGEFSNPVVNALYHDQPAATSELRQFLISLDPRLRLVYMDLIEFVRAVNITANSEYSLEGELYQEVMVAIHYRLANLAFDARNVNEAMRLALMAFSSTLFLQWRGLKMRYEYLAMHLRDASSSVQHETRSMPALVKLWLYMVGTTFAFDQFEQISIRPVLLELFHSMRLTCWNEVRASLKSVLWISSIHDTPAKKIVEAMLPEVSRSMDRRL